MNSIKKFLSILLLATTASGLSLSPAEAKKEFTKGGESAKTELGTNTATLPSGVKTKDIKVGTGPSFKYGDVVWIDYIGWVMPDSKEFDNTFKRGRPYNMVYGGAQVCKGLDEGIKDMKQGGKRLVMIPPELGFAKSASSLVPPNSTLKYEVTLVHVGWKLPKKPEAPEKDASTTPSKTKPASTSSKTAPKAK